MSEKEPRPIPPSQPEPETDPESELERFLEKNKTFEKRDLPTLETIHPKLREAATELVKISGSWNPVELYTVGSSSEEEEKKAIEAYTRGEQYSPTFTYPLAHTVENPEKQRERLKELQQQVRSLKVDREDRNNRLARIALERKIQDDIATTEIAEGIQTGNDQLTAEGMRKKYPGTDQEVMDYAQRRYEQLCRGEEQHEGKGILTPEEIHWLQETEFDAEEIKAAFEYALDKYGILKKEPEGTGFQVVVDGAPTSIDVRDKSTQGPTIFIPKKRKVTGEKLITLIDHEIGGHARQSMNGEHLTLLGGGPLKVDEETLYEGLAMRNESETNEKLFGKKAAAPAPYYAFAIKDAEEGKSFAEIFERQVDMQLHVKLKVNPEEQLPSEVPEKTRADAMKAAFRTTYRVMRGHTDTTNKEGYAMAKDLAYARGFMMQQRLKKEGLGHVNEAAVMARGGLPMLAEYRLNPDDLPIKYEIEDSTTGEKVSPGQAYFNEVLRPRMKAKV